jgi:hypothetical protein
MTVTNIAAAFHREKYNIIHRTARGQFRARADNLDKTESDDESGLASWQVAESGPSHRRCILRSELAFLTKAPMRGRYPAYETT